MEPMRDIRIPKGLPRLAERINDLRIARTPRLVTPTLTCRFGEIWEGPHPQCEAEHARACAAFDAAVARGEFNERGYTPKEWAAHLKEGRRR